MQEFLIEMLECPACHGELNWKIIQHQGDRIEEAEVNCKKCDGTYPVKEGIGFFLTPDLPRNDLWEQLDSQLIQYLRENPQIESKLMDTPLNTLNPADQFFRAQILEERGEFAQAKAIANLAYSKLYAPEYLKCNNAQINYLIAQLSIFEGPIIDLASEGVIQQNYLYVNLNNQLFLLILAPKYYVVIVDGWNFSVYMNGLVCQLSMLDVHLLKMGQLK